MLGSLLGPDGIAPIHARATSKPSGKPTNQPTRGIQRIVGDIPISENKRLKKRSLDERDCCLYSDFNVHSKKSSGNVSGKDETP
uniref:Uncharacterized protein n=1 Tax=Vespula pensylvanica TaxID=30213 RepID=A0A834P8I6_VESPE|nr:hypothetical protein H0235_004923 [Vespula pensylvanica]